MRTHGVSERKGFQTSDTTPAKDSRGLGFKFRSAGGSDVSQTLCSLFSRHPERRRESPGLALRHSERPCQPWPSPKGAEGGGLAAVRQSGCGAAGSPSQTFFSFSSFCLCLLDMTGSLPFAPLDPRPRSWPGFPRLTLSFSFSGPSPTLCSGQFPTKTCFSYTVGWPPGHHQSGKERPV